MIRDTQKNKYLSPHWNFPQTYYGTQTDKFGLIVKPVALLQGKSLAPLLGFKLSGGRRIPFNRKMSLQVISQEEGQGIALVFCLCLPSAQSLSDTGKPMCLPLDVAL